MSLSVVIPWSRGQQAPDSTLEGLLVQEQPLEEIVLVTAGAPGTQQEQFIVRARERFTGHFLAVQTEPEADDRTLWNRGIAAAKMDWVSVLTPQVTVRPNFSRALAESAERSPKASVLRGGWTRERPGGGAPEQHTLLSVRTVTHPAEALYEQRFGPKASSAAAAIRRTAWERMGELSPEITLVGNWIGDWALWLAAGALGDTVRSPEVLADLHTAPATVRKSEELRQMFLIYREILPRAATTAQLENCSWIEGASRKRFRDVTIAASNELRPAQEAERREIAAALQPWAEAADQVSLLNRFRAGERIRSFTFGQKMKPALRRVVAAVR